MEPLLAARAAAAAAALASELDLSVDHSVVLHDSNKLTVRLLPCDVVARVSRAGHDVAAFEVDLAQRLAATASPVAALEPRVAPRAHERDGFAVTFWTYYTPVAPEVDFAGEYAAALRRLHHGMRTVTIPAPHFLDRVAQARRLVSSRPETPELSSVDRQLLLDTLQDASERIGTHATNEQLLHGEPHPGNLLNTSRGSLFIDLETCCRGPVEFDVAHVPHQVSDLYPGLDQVVLAESRRLVLAMVAAWRWHLDDEFPDGLRHGRHLLALLRNGPPWPVVGALATE